MADQMHTGPSKMTPERWAQVDAVLSEALERKADQRADFLAQRCNGDDDLRRQVQALLTAHDAAGSFLDTLPRLSPPGIASPVEVATGRHIGPYRVLGEIGHGGMGAVYRAVRDDDQYRKEVAIKLVRGGLGDAFRLHRFKAERQILA